MKLSSKAKIIILISLALLLTSCVPGDGSNNYGHLAGFFTGAWHGLIAPVTLLLSYFNRHISIYERMNTGFSYNLGFYIAIISGFGGLTVFRRGNKNKKNN